MPRPPAVPLKGSFDSNTGIYTFDGVSWIPRWYANALKMSIQDCKDIIERGHKEDHDGLPQGVLVVGETKWKQIEKSYASWVGLTMFHYYEPNINPGEVPEWLKGIKAHGTKLIHEIKGGVCYLLTYNEEDTMYRYFARSAPPPEPTPGPQPTPTPGPTPTPSPTPQPSPLPSGTYKVSGYLTIEE